MNRTERANAIINKIAEIDKQLEVAAAAYDAIRQGILEEREQLEAELAKEGVANGIECESG